MQCDVVPAGLLRCSYNLPPNGTIKLYKELKCPLDGFDLLLYSRGNSERFVGVTYPLCPFCYNNPPFDGMTLMVVPRGFGEK